MKILLLSAYDAESHKSWRETLSAAFNHCHWTVLTLPARHFNWRIRGNSLSWAFSQRAVLRQNYDLIIATSMVDLSALRGLVPSIAGIPTLVYFHENQFAYPASDRQFSSIEPQILNLYTALAADKVIFNSAYNQSTFIAGVKQLLQKMPDEVPSGVVEQLSQDSSVLPVPLSSTCFKPHQPLPNTPLQLVWNHRWEYDKGPERLFEGIKFALEAGAELKLHIVGQQFRKAPPVFDQMRVYLDDNFPDVLGQWGFIRDVASYRSLLASADVVVSTALHDFQGLAVLEAVAAGCLALLPDRLCYPEWFEAPALYRSDLNDSKREAKALGKQLLLLAAMKSKGNLPIPSSVAQFSIESLSPRYWDFFQETIDRHGQHQHISV